MLRVIQDSDDELDDELEADVHQAESKDASPKQSTSDASSTETLRRQIEAAHRAHLQSQVPVHNRQTPATLEVNQSKRKLPAGFNSKSTSNEGIPSEKSPAICSGTSKSLFRSSPGSQQQDQNLVRQIVHSAGATNGADWVLEGTMREAYAQHDPIAMFPEPSSTVPNATLTQQRVMEGVLAPALLGSDVDNGGISFQPDGSIPWSEYLKSPSNTGEHRKSSTDEQTPARSQRERRESLTLVGFSSTQDTSLDAIDAQDIAMFPNNQSHVEATQMQTLSLPQMSESLISEVFTQGKAPNSSQQSCKKKQSPCPRMMSYDDRADLGLPKEQYKPRPSRSRSLKVDTQETIDYSLKPKKAAKASRRRKSTPASTSVVSPLCTPDKILQICDMGFTPSTSARALKQNNGDVTQTVDWLITNKIADDELVSHTSQMSTTGNIRPKANIDTPKHDGEFQKSDVDAKQIVAADIGATSDAMEDNTTSTQAGSVAPVFDLRSPPKVQVVIHAKSPKFAVEPSQKKIKRRRTELASPEPMATGHTVNGAKFEKKRGRGRPRKATNTPASMNIVQEEDEGTKEQLRDTSLLSVDANAAQPVLVQHQENKDKVNATIPTLGQDLNSFESGGATTTATTTVMPEPPVLPNRPVVEPITPERVKKPAPREQPLSNRAKVPYRVGLSKRARVTPLLRTMKK